MRELGIFAALAAASLLTRFLPFLIFPAGKKTPRFIEYLSSTLPYTTIGLLVIYCLKNVDLAGPSHGIGELTAVAATVALHAWRGNSLLSIGGGTAIYMMMVQWVLKA